MGSDGISVRDGWARVTLLSALCWRDVEMGLLVVHMTYVSMIIDMLL